MKTKPPRYLNKKPNLVIVHPPGTLQDYPFNISGYKHSYLDFMKLAEKKFNVFYVRGKNNYLGQGMFARGYLVKNGKFLPYDKKIAGRVLYNKTRLRTNGGQGWCIVNKEKFYKVTQNKQRTYKLFKLFMKPTYRTRNKQEFIHKLKKMKTDWAVFKPVRGAEGKGIVIGPKKNMLQKMEKYKFKSRPHFKQKNKYDGLLQEYIDTSEGIPGLHNTFHDMRITIMNGKIVQTYIRIPKPGSFLANVARGGRMKEIKKSKVPRPAIRIAEQIDKKFKKYGPRVYAIDFGFEKNKPYLIEINPQPGLPYPQWKMYYKKWHRELLKTLTSCL